MPCVMEEPPYILPDGSPTLVELLKDCDTFNNLEYSVTLRQRFGFSSTSVKTLLDDVSGEACDGDILAVLGASGAGKVHVDRCISGTCCKGES
ncbi:unnamed protein product [Brassica napus]|nr:unnamed protein product [Brassica napus]